MSSSSFKSSSFDTGDAISKTFPFGSPSGVSPLLDQSNDEEKIQRIPLPISLEYDSIREKYFSDTKVDRSKWVAKLLNEHPEIKELRDRVLPLDRAIEFGRLYLPDDRLIDHTELLSLVSQHLRTLGLMETQSSLCSEWDMLSNIPDNLDHSQLMIILQRGVLNAEKFWNLTMPGTTPIEKEQNAKNTLQPEIAKIIGSNPTLYYGKPLLEDRYNDQPMTTPKYTVYSLNQIIWICTTDSPTRTPEFIDIFSYPYVTICEPLVVFSKLQERFQIAFSENEHAVENTFNFFLQWYRNSKPIMDSRLISTIKSFVNTELRSKYISLSEKFYEPLPPPEPINYDISPTPDLGENPFSLFVGPFSLLCLTPREFARQYTLYTQERFLKIEPCEFTYIQDWNRATEVFPNIKFLQDSFDIIASNVTMWLTYPPKGFSYMDILVYFIRVAKECYDIQSYNCMMALLLPTTTPFQLDDLARAMPDSKLKDFLNLNLNSINGRFEKLLNLYKTALATSAPTMPFFMIYKNFFTSAASGIKDGIREFTIEGKVEFLSLKKYYAWGEELRAAQKRRFNFLPISQAQEAFSKLKNQPNDYNNDADFKRFVQSLSNQ
ncbi:hypothetical protein TVAG_235190 [Trichomonas vaginalis G3]|uniref:Ras-GEF domain-containing protein n=1 Tax=Trichomonas vaginalis (strain ATCC PRA-98 / G3) TaxID=412133 RepID=A2DPN7_TRIV3|nr:guanyl-nucleotide exchange factor protein [Trichomonas vaginalis G3]EAY17637.1 hypothetical protein TVAG_235190 [Trichomonas vaginalis G3]KAI5486119.1 guanyl-nucleotide exchange factor protein [Trichomonas vaginalis G3]|eukprot:XP_001329772.1 hypothetical protein [Trichomonas vaginalis G3]